MVDLGSPTWALTFSRKHAFSHIVSGACGIECAEDDSWWNIFSFVYLPIRKMHAASIFKLSRSPELKLSSIFPIVSWPWQVLQPRQLLPQPSSFKSYWNIFYLVHDDSRTPLVMVRGWSSVDLQCLAVVNLWMYYIDLDSHHGNGVKWDNSYSIKWFYQITISKMVEKHSWVWYSGCVFGCDGMMIGGSGRGRSEFWELLVNFQQYFGYLLR